MTKQTMISGAAMLALAWFACESGTFADELDRAPEAALVYELRSAGLLSADGMPTAKGEAVMAAMASDAPSKSAARAAFQAAHDASFAQRTDGLRSSFPWVKVALDGLGLDIEVRYCTQGPLNVRGFELRGNLYVDRTFKAPKLVHFQFGKKSELNGWVDRILSGRNETIACV